MKNMKKKTISFTVQQDCRKCDKYNGLSCKVYGMDPNVGRRQCAADQFKNYKKRKQSKPWVNAGRKKKYGI